MLLADGGKAFFQAQIGKLRDNMADNFIRRVSATGFDAMVKTSLFGYSESLESEADDFAIEELQRKGIDPAVFVTAMQRLHDEDAADEKKFSAFYATAGRMAERGSTGKKAVTRPAAEKASSAADEMAAPASPTVAAVPAGDTAEPGTVAVAAPTPPAETVTAAGASEAPNPAKPDGDGDGVTVVELPTMGSVAAVVIAGALEAASDSGGEGAAAPVVAGAAEAAANASAAASEAASETPPEGTVESTAESAAEDLAKA